MSMDDESTIGDSRRAFMRRGAVFGGVFSLIGFTGCIGDDGDTDNGFTPGEISIPNPVINSISAPQPVVIEIDEQSTDSEDRIIIQAVVENEGDPGDVHASLYWTSSETENEGLEEAEYADSTVEYIQKGERGLIEFEVGEPDDMSAFQVFATPFEVELNITNAGASGEIIVELLEGGEVVDEEIVTMEADEQSIVTFSREDPKPEKQWDVRVDGVDNNNT